MRGGGGVRSVFPRWGGAGFPWVSVRFLVLCGVFGGRGAGRAPSFFGAGGVLKHGVFAGARKQNKEKKKDTHKKKNNKK